MGDEGGQEEEKKARSAEEGEESGKRVMILTDCLKEDLRFEI